jgi:uncharacterized protein (TIGR02145 family)
MKNKFIFVQLFMIGLFLTTINSCKKDDTIIKKDPIITWTNPTDITIGTLLGATQLNATADVPGIFVYTPATGTKLNRGANQDLKVDFTPTDAINYNSASKTVKINVKASTTGIANDIDGNNYNFITIGTQVWMTENLKVTHYGNGDPIPNVTDNAAWIALTTDAYCSYKNTLNADTIATFGRLYNWYAVIDSRNIAPAGWHVPTDADWTTLATFLGGESVAGGKMKEAGTTHWAGPNTGATNGSGFTALPSGLRYGYADGSFGYLGTDVIWWSSTGYDPSNAWASSLYYNHANFYHDYQYSGKRNGYAVRLIKD